MSVKFRLYQNRNSKSEQYNKWYGRALVADVISTDQVATKISQRCTVHPADINAVLQAMAEVLKDELEHGCRVKLDKLGSFKVGMHTKLADTAEQFDPEVNVKSLQVIFIPETCVVRGKRMKTLLRDVKVAETPVNTVVRAKANASSGQTQNP